MSTTEARARGWRSVAALLGALAIAGVPAVTVAQAQPASAYASLENLPDWSGWWVHGNAPGDEARQTPPPIRPEILAAARAAGGADADPLRYCRPMQFTGSNGGFTEAVEFLFTPGRVTLTNERGLIRRIYTDGRPLPTGLNPTNTGWSAGRWEGQTLVVETTGINPLAQYPGAGGPAIGAGARVSERIQLRDKDTLQIDVVTVAPELLTKPDRRTRVYTRLPKTTATEVTFCTEYDRSIEPGTGVQRFDLTPPPDLPPPPQ